MGSGVIYAGIVAAWAAVLIPMWLHRHDGAGESGGEARAGDRFTQAMRVLSRRHRRHAEDLARTRPADEHADLDRLRTPRRPRSLVARRRRTLLGLLLATLAVLVLSVVGVLPSEVPALAVGVTVGYLVHLRLEARRDDEVARHRRASLQRTAARQRRLDAEERVTYMRRLQDEERAEIELAALEAEREQAALEEAERLAAEREDAGWEPRSAPLPRYVTLARASRAVRVIDVSSAGPWVARAAQEVREEDAPQVVLDAEAEDEDMLDAGELAEMDDELNDESAYAEAELEEPQRAVNT